MDDCHPSFKKEKGVLNMSCVWEQANQLQEANVTLTGNVRLVEYHPGLGEDVLLVVYQGLKIRIPRSELAIKPIQTSLIRYLGEMVEFKIIQVNEDEELIIGSMRVVLEEKRDLFLQQHAANPEAIYQGTIQHLQNFGAYIEMDGVTFLMLNRTFTDSFVTMAEVCQVGDPILFQVDTVKPNKIEVKPVEKYVCDDTISLEDFQPNQVVVGIVKSIKPTFVYTRIAKGLDALSPIPAYFEINEGDRVKFKINQVRLEEKRIRGKIVKVIQD